MNELQLAKQVAESLKKDKCADAFLNSSEEFRIELALAFASAEVRKFDRFLVEYLTKPAARKEFQNLVLAIT